MFRRIAGVGAAATLLLGLVAAPAPAAPPSTPDTQTANGQTANGQTANGQTANGQSLDAQSLDAQFAWVIDASGRVPVPAAEVAEHFDPATLAGNGGAAGFNQAMTSLGRLTAGPLVDESATRLRRAVGSSVGGLLATLTVNAAGLLIGLQFTPYLAAPTSWSELDTALRTLAPRVSFAAARVTPSGCSLVHGVEAGTARPLGSAFKLYVLGALAREIREGRLSWDTELALNPAWKSLPSGVLQDQPDGTKYTLAQYADYMISISDNTAADHLIHEVGRNQVQRQFTLFGNQARNVPLLTTREFIVLKGWHYPAAARAYAVLPPRLRALALPALDRVPRTAIQAWPQPEMIDQVEWFGSPLDMCRAFAGLWADHDPQVGAALTINDGGLGLPAGRFPTVWFKGGSEPGVLTLNYLARKADGSLRTASVMLSDPGHALNEATLIPRAEALLRGAFQLS